MVTTNKKFKQSVPGANYVQNTEQSFLSKKNKKKQLNGVFTYSQALQAISKSGLAMGVPH